MSEHSAVSSRAWIGKFIIGIGLVHTLLGVVFFADQFATWIDEGLWNTVNGQPEREFPFWFLSFGTLAIILGFLTDWIERRAADFPMFLGWSLLGLTVVMVFIMPASGGWLMFAPSIGAILRSRTGSEN